MGPAKILVIKLRSLGDTVIMTAPLKELIRAYPRSEIHVLVPSAWAPVLDGLSGIHKIWKLPPHSSKFGRIKVLARLALDLRRENYDWAINFHASSSSANLVRATGAPIRSVHYHGHHHPNRHSTVTIPGKGILKPIIERDMDALRALGMDIPAGRSPEIQLQPPELRTSQNLLERLNLKSPVLGLSLGASRPSKCWPIKNFASLAIEWCVEQNGAALALAGGSEESKIHEFLNHVNDLLPLSVHDPQLRVQVRTQITGTHELSLRELAGTISQFSVLAGNDSGPKHVGVAVGTPTVTLFGPEHPFEWHPYPIEHHPYLFIEPLSCRRDADPGMPAWCGVSDCIQEKHRCMQMIEVDSVLAECQRVARR